jgi:hypothetical protein
MLSGHGPDYNVVCFALLDFLFILELEAGTERSSEACGRRSEIKNYLMFLFTQRKILPLNLSKTENFLVRNILRFREYRNINLINGVGLGIYLRRNILSQIRTN